MNLFNFLHVSQSLRKGALTAQFSALDFFSSVFSNPNEALKFYDRRKKLNLTQKIFWYWKITQFYGNKSEKKFEKKNY